jgi:hypothetical protein
MSDQYLRKAGLIVSTGSDGLDLSNMRIVFRTTAMDASAPPGAFIRVYNLSDATATTVQKEFQKVTLQAGYETGNYGIIFQGTIKQVKRGKESAVDTFLDIYAADLDQAYNFGLVNKTLKAGSTLNDQVKASMDAMQKASDGASVSGSIPDSLGTGGTLPRGKVLFGLARERLTDAADSAGCTWSIQDGKVNIIPLKGYLPGEAVVINAQTGLIGIPEATNNGIEATVLLNPLIKLGTRVQIDNAAITNTTVNSQGFPSYTDLNFPASLSADGFYRTLVVEHRGDTRGNEWYSQLTCLALDASASPGSSVLAAG